MLETVLWNILDHLEIEVEYLAYRKAAFEDGDPHLIAAALGDVARARRARRRAGGVAGGRS